jgi:hypothetical protein
MRSGDGRKSALVDGFSLWLMWSRSLFSLSKIMLAVGHRVAVPAVLHAA